MAAGWANTQGGLSTPPSLCLLVSSVPGLYVALLLLLLLSSHQLLTSQLQVHLHQDVFLNHFSQHGYIWFLQYDFAYIMSGKGDS